MSSTGISHRRKRTTLLVHPRGIDVLSEYMQVKDNGLSDDEKRLAEELSLGLLKKNGGKMVILQNETLISSTMQQVLQKHWTDGKTTGEREESVYGESQGEKYTGHPDVVLRVTKKRVEKKEEGDKALKSSLLELAAEEKEDAGGESKSLVSNIFEIAVDNNGGERKHLQVYDYARFTTDKGPAFLLFVMLVDRDQKGCVLAITQESFIYCDRVENDQRVSKYGFLWREYYFAKTTSDIKSTVEKACRGIVRSVHCSTFFQKLAPYDGDWQTFHNNVAVAGPTSDDAQKWVYKVFDNRYLPTQRKPENWVGKPWSDHLKVTECLVYEEATGAKLHLGKPTATSSLEAKASGHDNPSPRKKKAKVESGGIPDSDIVWENMPYGTGAIVVIRYQYQNGTHTASKVSHLQSIAHQIKKMHNSDMVHGDIRGHNLLHPSGQEGSITKSCLIDFDLAGEHGRDRYPSGFSNAVPENNPQIRGLKANQTMEKNHDWYAFGCAIGIYELEVEIPDHEDLEKATDFEDVKKLLKASPDWKKVRLSYTKKKTDMENPTKAIDDFVNEHGTDIKISIVSPYDDAMNETQGTGSPEKPNRARGKNSLSNSVSQETQETE